MANSLVKPESWATVATIGRMLVKHSRAGLFDGIDADVPAGSGRPDELADELEAMGPTWVKFGQLLSTRPDLIPAAYIDALTRLQDRVEPFSGEEARAVIEQELGAPVNKIFSDFEDEAYGSGSLADVHRASLRDGTPVAVKVQRPGAREMIERDMAILADVAKLVEEKTEVGRRVGAAGMCEEMERSLMEELDFEREADNLRAFGDGVREFEHLVVPRPYRDLCADQVLTMEMVDGVGVADLSPMARMELDSTVLLEELFRAYLEMALIHGLVHADPHPGNVLITPEGKLALIDAGMVLRIPEHQRDPILELLVSLTEGQGKRAAEILESVSKRSEAYDATDFHDAVARLVADYHSSGYGNRPIGQLVLETARIAMDSGLRVPREAPLLGKTLLNLDETARRLDPDFRPDDTVRDTAGDLVQRRTLESLAPHQTLRAVLETKEFVTELPGRLNRVLDHLGQERFELNVHLPNESPLMKAAQKMANRITAGLVIASLIIGAAMLMSVPSNFQIFGYPGLAILFFMVAAAMGAILLRRIWKDV